MYDQFYGFTGRPFQLTPDPHFYYESGTHRKAMSYLGYGLAQGEGFIVITGDIGAGKTTLVGHLMNTIDPNRLTAVKLVSTQVEGDDLLRLVAEQFQIDWDGLGKAELLRAVEQFLREQARAGRRTLLIVDEGQNLAISALEELRMLSNFQLGGHSLLQIFLLGQPEFRQTLFQSPTLEQLRQRVIATHHLDPMEPEEVEPYILHRLGKVGWSGNPSFSPDAFEAIFDYSEGVPRKLNVLVSRLLLFGAVEQLSRITAQHVRAVVAEISADGGIVASEAPAPQPAPLAAPVVAPVAPPVMAAPFVAAAAEEAEPIQPPFGAHGVVAPPAADPVPIEVLTAAPFSPYGTPSVSENDDESALQWPAPTTTPTEAAAPAPLAEAPFAAPGVSPLGQFGRRTAIDDVEILPPSRGASSFIEARSLVAEHLTAAHPADTAEPDFGPVAAVLQDEAPPFELQMAERDFAPADSVEEVVTAAGEDHMVALARQIAGLEARIVDQDAALRRVLDLLIDWVERDPANAPAAQTWAA